jgi:hypothetical protein
LGGRAPALAVPNPNTGAKISQDELHELKRKCECDGLASVRETVAGFRPFFPSFAVVLGPSRFFLKGQPAGAVPRFNHVVHVFGFLDGKWGSAATQGR